MNFIFYFEKSCTFIRYFQWVFGFNFFFFGFSENITRGVSQGASTSCALDLVTPFNLYADKFTSKPSVDSAASFCKWFFEVGKGWVLWVKELLRLSYLEHKQSIYCFWDVFDFFLLSREVNIFHHGCNIYSFYFLYAVHITNTTYLLSLSLKPGIYLIVLANTYQ